MAERDAQMLAAANTVHRQHAGQVRALLAAARAEGCGFIGGPGGRALIESTEAVIRALEALSGLLCQGAPPLEEVLAQLLELAWDAVRASAASVRVLRSAALAGGTWADPGPSEVATARVCVQAHRAHQRLVEDGAQLLRRVLRLGWGAEMPRALLELSLDRQLDALEARVGESARAATAAAAGLGAGTHLLSFPAPWEAPVEP